MIATRRWRMHPADKPIPLCKSSLLAFVAVLNVVFATPAANADLFRAESESLTSFRRNEKYNLETPVYEFLATSYSTDHHELEINTDFGFFTDPTGQESSHANLYLFDAQYALVPDRLAVKVGRSFDVINTIGAASVDQISLETYFWNHQLVAALFAGTQRSVESTATGLYSNLAGARLTYQSNEPQALWATTKFMQRSNPTNGGSLENLVEFSGRKAFLYDGSPEFLFDAVSDVGNSNLNRADVGIDFYPGIMTYIKLRYQTLNIQPYSGLEQPIYTLFATGPLNEFRFQYEQKITSHWISSVSFTFDQFEMLSNPSTTASGHGYELEAKYLSESPWSLDNVVYAFQSYGGSVLGFRTQMQTLFKQARNYYALYDIAQYDKITSSQRPALTIEAGMDDVFARQYKLTIGGQVSSNNVLKDDLRAIARLTYMFWGEI